MYSIRRASSAQVEFVPMNNTRALRAFIIVNTATAIVQAPVVQRGDNLYHLEFIFVLFFGGVATSTLDKNGQALEERDWVDQGTKLKFCG